MLAEVRCSCGRYVLFVGGIAVAMEGDACRQILPEDLYEIPKDELETGHVGGEPIKEMSNETAQFFRGGAWDEKSLEWAAAQINTKANKE